MDHFFPTNDFSLLESCHLYVIAKYKTSNCCKIEAVIQRYLAKLTGELLCQRLFRIKLQRKKILWHRRFPVNIAKVLRTPFYRTPSVTAPVKIRTKSLKSAKFQFQLFLTTSTKRYQPYSPFYNLAPPIFRVLIGQYLIFCSLKSPTCCSSLRKCTPVKYKKKQKLGSQLSHRHAPTEKYLWWCLFTLQFKLENS